jgi:hypothetical protein
MSEKPISPLRQRMLEDMSVRNFGEQTRNDYTATSGLSQPSSAARRIWRRQRIFAASSCIRDGPACGRRP